MTVSESDRFYAAFKAKDARFDGRVFIGVTSTGIYCRPVCRARLPKAAHCRYFRTAAEAECAGFRPCLLCRPEQAPGLSVTDASSSLARRAAKLLAANCGSGFDMESLAGKLGCTARHLRRVFTEAYGVTPIRYLQTCRLHLAKALLADTALTITDAAMASGFGSLRRFNDACQKQYRLTPTELRGQSKASSGITVTIGFRPPYPWAGMLDFLARRAIAGVEVVRDGQYWRTIQMAANGQASRGWICAEMHPHKHAIVLTLSESLLPVLPQVMVRARALFDLDCDPEAICEVLSGMEGIRPGLCVKGTRLPGCFDPFELSVRAVLGQQIAVKAASTLSGRVAAAFGEAIETGIEGLTHTFPAPECFDAPEANPAEALSALGIIAARARAIVALAQGIAAGALVLHDGGRPEEEMAKLCAIQGIGNWTAQYIAMRAMGWTDAFLETDAAVKKALTPRTPKEMLAAAEAWRPWRSYAVMNLWNSL